MPKEKQNNNSNINLNNSVNIGFADHENKRIININSICNELEKTLKIHRKKIKDREDEESLFKYMESLDIIKEYNDYFNADSFGKEKIDLFQDL